MEIQKQSTKFVKPATQTPPALHHYKIGYMDECAPPHNISIVLFYSVEDSNDNLSRLEKSLEKTLTRFYPLAGRYLEDDHVIQCLDQGVEFIHAKAINIKYEDIVCSEVHLKLVDEFIPSALGAVDQVTDPLLSIQVTTFEYGVGVAVGVSISHRVADVATLVTFLNDWAAISRSGESSDAEFGPGIGFNSATFFPARGSSSTYPVRFPRTKSSDNMYRSKHVTKILSLSESEISNLRDKIIGNGQHCSKVQLVSAIIWKTLLDIEQRKNNGSGNNPSVLLWGINLRGKTTSVMPQDSFGNLSALLAAKCETNVENVESLVHLVRKSVKEFIENYSKVRHDKEQVRTMVANSLSYPATNIFPNTVIIGLISWCKFPYYQLEFGFGKPKWVTCGRVFARKGMYLMDDVGGNGIEAYVGVQDEDVSYLQEALNNIKALAQLN